MSEQTQAIRITSADVYHKPELLLHSACPDAPLTAFDGRVGAVIGDTGYFVTSPNMDLVYSPHFTLCSTRMRRDYHFSTDDPMYFPQPFNMTLGIDPNQKTSSLTLPIHCLIKSALRLVEGLQLAATQDKSLLLLANIQCQYLELYARLEWLNKYLPCILGQEKTHSVDSRLMGAFAYSPDDLQRLYHAGIPVWYVWEVTYLPLTLLDLADADPPHRVIWSGGWTQGEHYAAMARYIRTLYQFPVMGTLTGPPSSPAAPSTSSSTSPSISSLTSPTSQVLVDILSKGPVPPRPKNNPQKVAKLQCLGTSFFHLSIPSAAVPAWGTALSELSSFHDVRIPEKLGTYLPQPESLLSSDSELTQAYLISTWVKLRPLFLWLLSNAGSNPLNLKGHQWRSILDLGHGLQYKEGSGTSTSWKHTEMENLLRLHLADRRHHVELTFETLPTADVEWRGEALLLDRLPRLQVAKEILWELYEINFRMELMTLDRTLLLNVEWGLRQNELSHCWDGLPFHVNFDHSGSGLGSPSFLQRLPYTQALYYVIRAWPGPKPDEITFPFPIQITDGSVTKTHFEKQVTMVEEALARFYVRTFFNTFARAPTIPHCLSSL
ncbi:hypothetical protein K435DRAFT_857976 [Dendrothele bispora CBS 962.96]|uniref:Uncharacterized protein n=1 Tax=Dendrothele bispora (strain CBS 962.96) TaxID=1314807 RepID=A0A4S8M4F8_DENBC|nr:hypothetical protein K435DRAFT_857976 [Dendrothele bispora CBS 962.96]